MLPTFVIGLREGLEAALIVGIIAAFLRKQGRRDLLRWVFVGVGTAVLLCIGVGVALEVLSRDLPQRQQEGLETVVGVLAVAMVTYMVVWMKRHSRELKGQLEGLAADAIAGRSKAGRAMVLMAFLAVLREGLETVVFLLAAFNEAGSGVTAGVGALVGILVAVALGYGIYRGGVRLNLSKFFRATGLVLVLVAAGLVVNALHTAHEAGWLNSGQGSTVDLTALVRPGSVQSSLLTGMLGVQQHPVVIEVIGWLAYLIPVGLYVAWPPGRGLSRTSQLRALTTAGVVLAGAAIALVLAAPGAPAVAPTSSAAGSSARVVSAGASSVLLRTVLVSPVISRAPGAPVELQLQRSGMTVRDGLPVGVYTAAAAGAGAKGRPASVSYGRIAALNGGRLPLGLSATGTAGTATVHYTDRDRLTAWIEPRTQRVLAVRWQEQVVATVQGRIGAVALAAPIASATAARDYPAAAVGARAGLDALDRRSTLHTTAWWCAGLATVALFGVALAWGIGRRRRPDAQPAAAPAIHAIIS